MGYRAGTEVPDQSLTEAKMAAAATFTPEADSFTFEHNNKSAILVTLPILLMDGYASDATTGIAPGSVVGQTLLIVLVHNGYINSFTLTDGGNVSLRGNWKAAANQSAMLLVWDGATWLEMGRWVNVADGDASGENAVVFGSGNATGKNSTSIGGGGTASGEYAVVVGGKGTASGQFSATLGGFWTGASGPYSTAFGNLAAARLTGELAQSSGNFGSASGQYSSFVIGRTVTHSTGNWYDLLLGDYSKLLIEEDHVWVFDILITGMTDDAAKVWAYHIRGVIRNGNGTTTLLGSNVDTVYENTATFDAQVVADDANDALVVQVKDSGAGGDEVGWVAHVRVVEAQKSSY